MSLQYRIETTAGASAIMNPTIIYDYLTLEKFDVAVVKSLDVKIGDHAKIFDSLGHLIFTGVITGGWYANNLNYLQLRPELAFADTSTTFLNTTTSLHATESPYAEYWVAAQLNAIETARYSLTTKRSLLPREYNITTQTSWQKPSDMEDVYNAWDVAVYALKTYGIVVDGNNIGKIEGDPIQININDPYILNKDIVSSEGSDYDCVVFNQKVTYPRDSGYPSYSGTVYYLHKGEEGQEDIVDTNKPAGFVYSSANVYETTWSKDKKKPEVTMLSVAKDILLQQGSNTTEIKITVSNDCRIFDPNMPVGTRATIYNGDIQYETICTGFAKDEAVTTLYFGCLRTELTKKMALAKRASGYKNYSSHTEETITIDVVGGGYIHRTSGNATMNHFFYKRFGNTVSIFFQLTASSTTASASNFYDGQLDFASGVVLPEYNVTGCSYYSATPVMAAIYPTGRVVVRNAGTTARNLADGCNLMITYVLD